MSRPAVTRTQRPDVDDVGAAVGDQDRPRHKRRLGGGEEQAHRGELLGLRHPLQRDVYKRQGLYIGYKMGGRSSLGGGGFPDEILVFRDTLVGDFGDDPERLRLKIIQTVRHEVGHHLGFDEAGVRKLGL